MTPEESLALAQRFMSLPAAKRTLFWQALNSDGLDYNQLPIPLLAEAPAIRPASHAQQRMWLLWRLDPHGTAYHLGCRYRLQGELNVGALQAACDDLVARQQSLRTTFVEQDGQLCQHIHERALSTLTVEDTAEHIDAVARQPFDLRRGPLFRAHLFREPAGTWCLSLVLHHSIADGWSLDILVGELLRGYAARCQGQAGQWPALALHYADFARWQRYWLEAGEEARQLAYWRAQLGPTDSVLELPEDKPRPSSPSYRGAAVERRLPAACLQALQTLAQSRRTTLFVTLLAAFQAVLQRYSGQSLIRVGVPIANRPRQELENLIGFFANTQVMVANFTDGMSFDALLDSQREASLGAQAHQDLPFERLVEALQPARDASRNPLFQAMFSHAPRALGERQVQHVAGLECRAVAQPVSAAQFDLGLNTFETVDGELLLRLGYATDLFEQATVQRLLDHLVVFLGQMEQHHATPLADTPLLSASERTDLLVTRNATARQWPANDLLGLIAGQLESDPQAIAVVAGNEQLSRAELAERSDRLAAWLRGRGVGIDSRVGIAAERSVELVVGLLGILKAGAAYVPLDSDYPAQRLQWMLEDSGMQLLLTQQRLLDRLPASAVPSFCLDRDWAQVQACAPLPTVDVPPLAAAYCIYTSGSTGRPKGVINSHAGLYNRLLWMQDAYGLTELDRVLQKTPISFDVSVWEFFWPLLTGARLVMAPPGAHRDPRQLRACIVEQGVTTLHFVPSMLQAFVGSGELAHCPSLTRILCSGEALPADLQQRTRAEHPAALYNLYGPTEAAIDVTAWTCGDWPRPCTPIGRPIANTQIHVLDEQLQPVPLGVAGELYIGGINLARGYLNRPGLTAERFVADPFGSGGRLYRSGDRARWTAEGEIEYLGRLDHQVKLRGQRLELGEIEARLRDYPGITAAAVILRDGPAGQQLIGYVCGPAAQEEDALRAHLAQTLPEALLPARLLALEHLPLTPNGKLDRNALPQVELPERAFEAPHTSLEQALADMWVKVLGVERVGRQDNFFALGGHSLTLVQLAADIDRRWSVELPFRRLFEHPTLAALATELEETLAVATPLDADLDELDGWLEDLEEMTHE
jgi:amino acid adenylation domain-containing protein